MDYSNSSMNVLLFLALSINLASAAGHSLQYFYTAGTPGVNFPEFTIVGLVDGEQFLYYDSVTRKMIPKTEWIENVEHDDPDYWQRNTLIEQGTQEIFADIVATAMEHQTKGVHTVQLMCGCELDDDGSKRGYEQYGYDGDDFISLDLNTETWTAATAKALITKHKWNSDVGYGMARKNYLVNTCPECLKKYVDYGRAALERKDPPEVTLFQKDSSFPVVCHATGFFPRGVMISWKKNGEELHEDVELRETLPNGDGTFQKRSILTVPPEELKKNNYTCVVQHSGLDKEFVLKDDRRVLNPGGVSIIISVVAVLLILIGSVGVFIWKKNNIKMTSASVGRLQITSSLHFLDNITPLSRRSSEASDAGTPTSSYSICSTTFLI